MILNQGSHVLSCNQEGAAVSHHKDLLQCKRRRPNCRSFTDTQFKFCFIILQSWLASKCHGSVFIHCLHQASLPSLDIVVVSLDQHVVPPSAHQFHPSSATFRCSALDSQQPPKTSASSSKSRLFRRSATHASSSSLPQGLETPAQASKVGAYLLRLSFLRKQMISASQI